LSDFYVYNVKEFGAISLCIILFPSAINFLYVNTSAKGYTPAQFIPYGPPLVDLFCKKQGGSHTELLNTKFFEIHYCFQTFFQSLYWWDLNYTTSSGKEISIKNFLTENFEFPIGAVMPAVKRKAWTNATFEWIVYACTTWNRPQNQLGRWWTCEGQPAVQLRLCIKEKIKYTIQAG